MNGRLLIVGLILLAAGGLFVVLEYREAKRGGSMALQLRKTAEEVASPFETRAIAFDGNDLVCKFHASAPVDNSWMFVNVVALDDSGRASAGCSFNIAYYHGIKDGREWQTGRREARGSLILPAAGSYRMRFSVTAGEGQREAPDVARVAKPMEVTMRRTSLAWSRFRVGAFMALTIAGGALVLRALGGLSGSAPTNGQTDAAATGPLRRLRQPSGARMAFLDGLRGIACVSVLLCHLFVPEISAISESLKAVVPAFLPALLRHGDLGVEVFFVLSGFVIAYSLRNHRINGSLAWRFAVRRSIRLDPPYLFTLVLAIGVWALVLTDSFNEVGEKFEGVPGLLANAFYLQDILRYPAVFSVAWTLCLEIQFYLAFVLLAGAAQWLGNRLPGRASPDAGKASPFAALVIFMPLGLLSVAMWYLGLAAFTFPGTWFRFFLGVLVFWAIERRVPRLALYGFAALLLILSISTGDLRGGVAMVTAGVIFVAGVRGYLTRWLSGRLWQYLGRISYSLYLLHIVVGIPFINWIWTMAPQSSALALVLFPTTIGVSVAFAHLFHAFFERPSLALSRLIHY
ncbi:MAG: acyltransferase [Chthoniobacteraceae bacterium]